MDFSWEPAQGTPALWTVDLGRVSQAGPIPAQALHSPGPGDYGPELRELADWGGAALALAAWKALPDARLALVVGRSVRAGQATASRASVLARSPLTGRLSQGQLGTDLGRRLGALCDGILLRGETRVPDAVLILDASGGFRLESVPGVKSLDTRQSAQVLGDRFGDGSILRAGPAAHAGVLWSNLCAGQDPASFVGSGGMGAVLAGTGLAALVICSPPVESEREDEGWFRSLVRSPRLIARAQGQSLQEADREPTSPESLKRHGCEGCPTPCGFVFERPGRGKGSARFSALRPLMDLVGDPDGTGLQRLLQTCNDLGVDAREAAACLRLVVEHGETRGLELSALLRGLCLGEFDLPAFGEGAIALARHYAVPTPDTHLGTGRRGHASDPAHLLAQQLGVRGTEPLRSYPFLVGQHTEGSRMRSLVAPLYLPPGSGDPGSTVGKGRLLWWHENLICGVDVLGICAFTVAALLSDGVSDLEELAGRILPGDLVVPGSTDRADALLAMGANVLRLYRDLDYSGRSPGSFEVEVPEDLQVQSREYLSLRGLRPDGWPDGDSGVRLGRAEWTHVPEGMLDSGAGDGGASPGRGHGGVGSRVGVELRFQGALVPRLGEGLCLWFEGGATPAGALLATSQLFPRHAHWLVSGGQPVPAVLRRGQVLESACRLEHGDVLELVLAISGG